MTVHLVILEGVTAPIVVLALLGIPLLIKYLASFVVG